MPPAGRGPGHASDRRVRRHLGTSGAVNQWVGFVPSRTIDPPVDSLRCRKVRGALHSDPRTGRETRFAFSRLRWSDLVQTPSDQSLTRRLSAASARACREVISRSVAFGELIVFPRTFADPPVDSKRRGESPRRFAFSASCCNRLRHVRITRRALGFENVISGRAPNHQGSARTPDCRLRTLALSRLTVPAGLQLPPGS